MRDTFLETVIERIKAKGITKWRVTPIGEIRTGRGDGRCPMAVAFDARSNSLRDILAAVYDADIKFRMRYSLNTFSLAADRDAKILQREAELPEHAIRIRKRLEEELLHNLQEETS